MFIREFVTEPWVRKAVSLGFVVGTGLGIVGLYALKARARGDEFLIVLALPLIGAGILASVAASVALIAWLTMKLPTGLQRVATVAYVGLAVAAYWFAKTSYYQWNEVIPMTFVIWAGLALGFLATVTVVRWVADGFSR